MSQLTRKLSVQTRAELALVFVTVLWGITFPVIRIAVQEIDGRYFVALRFWLAFLVFIPIALSAGLNRTKLKAARAPGMLTGFIMTLVFLFQTIGLETVSSPRAAFITSAYVIFVPLFSPLFGRKLPSLLEFAASAVALVGLFLIMNPTFESGVSTGDLWVLGCAISSAIGIHTTGKIMRHDLDVMGLVFWQLLTIALFSTLTLGVGGPTGPLHFSWPVISAILLCALGVTLGVFILLLRSQKVLPPERVALIYSLEPLFAVLFGYLILGELLSLRSFLGGLLILLAVMAPRLRKFLCA